ncbi:hypothetical protein BDF21DRAFT_416833 [Thamnidium elegans]|nr:hypothetical protein BDF21DRAFT_416833 [Thamnidium elegans]
MHFLGEACYRRPLEPKILTYSRGGTALTMGVLFLAFCGYLINLIYRDVPLLQLSSETMKVDIQTPDIEICAQNSTLTIVRCNSMEYDWNTKEIPNCYQDYFRKGEGDETSKCYMFETKDRFRMATGNEMVVGPNAIRRLDFYWHVDSLVNISAATIAVPAITVQLYDPRFNGWNEETIGSTPTEKKFINNIRLGISRSTSFINFTSNIFYRPEKYKAIRPYDAATVFGLKSNFIEINTLANYQHNWPLQSNPAPPAPPTPERGTYHGVFSVQLSQGTLDVKTEVRQNTLLASVALAGGCYGVLTTLYILLFGMTRLTPWGLVHHIPVFISKHRRHDTDVNNQDSIYNSSQNGYLGGRTDEEGGTIKKKKSFYSNTLVPWFFRSRLRKSDESFTTVDAKEAIMTKMIARSKMQDREQLPRLSRIDSTELQLLDSVRRPELPITNSSSFTNIEGLGTHDSYDKALKKLSLSTQVSADSTDILYQTPTLANFPPALPPHGTTAGGSRGEGNFMDSNEAMRREQLKTIALETRTSELANRVEELEIILSEYFINTAYLDQLRVRRNATVTPSDLPEVLP